MTRKRRLTSVECGDHLTAASIRVTVQVPQPQHDGFGERFCGSLKSEVECDQQRREIPEVESMALSRITARADASCCVYTPVLYIGVDVLFGRYA